MSQMWYYAKADQKHGPVSFEELQALVGSGELGATDLVWTDGMDAWGAARSVKGLGPFAPSGPPPLPTSPPMTTSSLSQAAHDLGTAGLGLLGRFTKPGTAKAAPEAVELPAAPVRPAKSGSRTAVLVLTIIGAFFSVFVGGCTSAVHEGVANTGDSVNRWSDDMHSRYPTSGSQSDRIDTEKVRAAGANYVLLGFLEAILGIVGGIIGYRHFGTPNRMTVGPLSVAKTRLAGGLILVAALMGIMNLFTFITAGIMNGVASALCLLSKPEPGGP